MELSLICPQEVRESQPYTPHLASTMRIQVKKSVLTNLAPPLRSPRWINIPFGPICCPCHRCTSAATAAGDRPPHAPVHGAHEGRARLPGPGGQGLRLPGQPGRAQGPGQDSTAPRGALLLQDWQRVRGHEAHDHRTAAVPGPKCTC